MKKAIFLFIGIIITYIIIGNVVAKSNIIPDDAIRIRVYKNDSFVTYAKLGRSGVPERDTVAFEDDTHAALDHVENFMPGDVIKYTIVIWLEGNDPECTDNLLGGEIKLHMEFNSEFIEEKEEGEVK